MVKAFSPGEREIISQRLLDQGYRLFSLYGLKKTNIDEIAAAAGISKGAFYRFYDSKEALFMDVIEMVEVRLRKELLATIDLPGPTPRARLFAILLRAFNLFREMPILQFLGSGDYDLLFRRIPSEKVQQHLASDGAFISDLIAHCQAAGIPIRVTLEEIANLLYPLVIATIHQGDLNLPTFRGGIDHLLELSAAYCLGEIELDSKRGGNELGD